MKTPGVLTVLYPPLLGFIPTLATFTPLQTPKLSLTLFVLLVAFP